jgi:GGDEF domain-containing protein
MPRKKLAFASNHAPLTGIANRRAFMEAVDRAIKEADKRADRPGIIFIDLDSFYGLVLGTFDKQGVLRQTCRSAGGCQSAHSVCAALPKPMLFDLLWLPIIEHS